MVESDVKASVAFVRDHAEWKDIEGRISSRGNSGSHSADCASFR